MLYELSSLWKTIAGEAVEKRGRFSVALSGGTTPLEFYEWLAQVRGLPWNRTDLFLVDERLVPVESLESNSGLILRSLVRRLEVPPGGVHLPNVSQSPEAVARSYERQIVESFGKSGGALPAFDLVLLGIGADGHTASLFPGTPELEERSRLVVAVAPTPSRGARVTMTLPILNAARNVVFLVVGESKRRALAGVLRGDERLPASRVRPPAGVVRFFADAQALPAA